MAGAGCARHDAQALKYSTRWRGSRSGTRLTVRRARATGPRRGASSKPCARRGLCARTSPTRCRPITRVAQQRDALSATHDSAVSQHPVVPVGILGVCRALVVEVRIRLCEDSNWRFAGPSPFYGPRTGGKWTTQASSQTGQPKSGRLLDTAGTPPRALVGKKWRALQCSIKRAARR